MTRLIHKRSQPQPSSRTRSWARGAVATTVALAAGVMPGLVPALLSGRGALAPALKTGSREGTHQRSLTRAALLVTQGALSVALLIGAVIIRMGAVYADLIHNLTEG